MTIANFKQQVANMLNRSLATITADNSQDMLLMAMNDARRAAQRAHDFELLRGEDNYLTTSASGADWSTGCKTTPGGATAQLMKRIDEVWNYATGTAVAAYYPRTTRVPFNYTGYFKRVLPVVDSTIVTNPASYTIMDRWAYANGVKLFIPNATAAVTVKLVGITWLDDLTGSESPDMFLTFFTDWFRYATLQALNVYLKDSERFPIDQAVMSNLWSTVKTFDGTIANMGDSSASLS